MVVPGASVSELHLSAAPQRNTTDFTYWCVGNCSATTATPALPATERVRKGGVVLMGGGTDTDDGFRQMIDWSDDGNFLVIRAYGDDAYNQYIDDLGKGRLSSVATLLTKSRNASVSGMRWLLSRHDLLVAVHTWQCNGSGKTSVVLWFVCVWQQGSETVLVGWRIAFD